MGSLILRMLRCAVVPAVAVLAVSAAGAQNGNGIFVTPIPNVPFSGTVRVERTSIRPDGSTVQTWSQRLIARDNGGRIYNEYRPFMPMTVSTVPPATSIHLYDPQNRMSESLYPLRKTYEATILNRPPSTDTPDDFASPTSASAQPSDFARREDLGNRTIAGVSTHGVRVSQVLPAAQSGTGRDVVVVNEYWYAEALRLNLLTRHDDPRTGSVTMTVTEINRTEPNAALFGVPSNYTMAAPAR